MRNLYETKGYVNFVATPVPMFEESRRTIDMVIAIDEGKPFKLRPAVTRRSRASCRRSQRTLGFVETVSGQTIQLA